MSYISYEDLNTLDEISFIGGNTYYIEFIVYNDSGVPISMVNKKLEWKLAPYGEKNFNTLIKTEVPYISGGITYGGGVTNPDLFTKLVTLTSADTEALSGKFVQQVVIIQTNLDLTTTTFKPAQGVVTILSDIYKP